MFFDVDRVYTSMEVDYLGPEYVVCNDILYADDTMLVSANQFKLQSRLDLANHGNPAYWARFEIG